MTRTPATSQSKTESRYALGLGGRHDPTHYRDRTGFAGSRTSLHQQTQRSRTASAISSIRSLPRSFSAVRFGVFRDGHGGDHRLAAFTLSERLKDACCRTSTIWHCCRSTDFGQSSGRKSKDGGRALPSERGCARDHDNRGYRHRGDVHWSRRSHLIFRVEVRFWPKADIAYCADGQGLAGTDWKYDCT